MPRSYRCILLAVVGWVALAGANNKNLPKQGVQREQLYNSHEIAVAINNATAALQKPPKPPSEDRGCQGGKEDRYSDLCAQWKAADAAAEGAMFTKWAFFAAVVGSVLAFFAVIYTAKAAKIAQLLVDGVERPYLHIEILDRNFRGVEAPQGVLAVRYMIKNIGRAPAFIDTIYNSLKFEPQDTNIGDYLGGSNPSIVEPQKSAGPYTVDCPIPPNGLLSAFGEGRGLILRVHISYVDTMMYRRNLFYGTHYSPPPFDVFHSNDHARTIDVPFDHHKWTRRRNSFRFWRFRSKEWLLGIPKAKHNPYPEGHPSYSQDRRPEWLRWAANGFRRPPPRWEEAP